MTITGTEAYEAMRTHHRVLSEQLSTRAAAVSEAVTAGRPHQAAVASLVAYLAGEVLPHAAAEEQTIYPAAALRGGLIGTVNEMLAEHHTLSAAAGALTGLADGTAAAGQARQIAELFAAHAARENDVLLPALLADHDVDLAALLAQMHRRAEEAARAAPPGDTTSRDPQGALVGLLLEAARALARAGQADLACQLAAAAWAVLREERPDLAVTVTAALHGLTRRAGGGPAQAGAPPAPVSRERAPAARQARPVSTCATCRRRSAMTRSSRPTGSSARERVSCWSTTTTPSRCGTSSRPSTRASSPGTAWGPAEGLAGAHRPRRRLILCTGRSSRRPAASFLPPTSRYSTAGWPGGGSAGISSSNPTTRWHASTSR